VWFKNGTKTQISRSTYEHGQTHDEILEGPKDVLSGGKSPFNLGYFKESEN
jgi:hypothetical protein